LCKNLEEQKSNNESVIKTLKQELEANLQDQRVLSSLIQPNPTLDMTKPKTSFDNLMEDFFKRKEDLKIMEQTSKESSVCLSSSEEGELREINLDYTLKANLMNHEGVYDERTDNLNNFKRLVTRLLHKGYKDAAV
jgi:hypothetical protein